MSEGQLRLLSDQAVWFHRNGDLEKAERLYSRILTVEPGNFFARHMLGVIRSQQGRNGEALALIGAALSTNPDVADALSNYGNVLIALGRFAEALLNIDKALAIEPDFAVALYNRGLALSNLNRFEEALASYDKALAIQPDHAEALDNRGVTLSILKRFEEALASYDRALAIKPNYAEALNNRGVTLSILNRFEEALATYDKALAIKPNYAEAWGNRGHALSNLNRFEEALASYDKALAIKPNYAEVWGNRGTALLFLGKFNEARASYNRALTLNPKLTEVHLSYTGLVNISADDPHLKTMEALDRASDSLGDTGRIQLDFALAKAYADLKDYGRSFKHLLSGNALKRKQIQYNETERLRGFDRIETVFTAELVRKKEKLAAGDPTSVPIFIIGMMRSGTTLVEQILASHPDVRGAGEITTLKDAASEIFGLRSRDIPYPECVPGLDARAFDEIGARYLEEIRKLAPTAARITNKTTTNYYFAGLIHLALPNARIIHTVRDPIDTCFSCFSKHFTEEQNHTYDLAELGRYYHRYRKLMEHWHRVLPPGRILEVRYEDVVADLEGQARRIVAHCGLEWDARCLSFHTFDRPISTASVTQVRQPIYKSAIGRARNYEEFLGPLKEALAGDDSIAQFQPKSASGSQ